MFCSNCGDDRRFEPPPCPDGHGGDCPELACVDCGEALIGGFPLPDPARVAEERPVSLPSRAA